jgi:hypothetical protein
MQARRIHQRLVVARHADHLAKAQHDAALAFVNHEQRCVQRHQHREDELVHRDLRIELLSSLTRVVSSRCAFARRWSMTRSPLAWCAGCLSWRRCWQTVRGLRRIRLVSVLGVRRRAGFAAAQQLIQRQHHQVVASCHSLSTLRECGSRTCSMVSRYRRSRVICGAALYSGGNSLAKASRPHPELPGRFGLYTLWHLPDRRCAWPLASWLNFVGVSFRFTDRTAARSHVRQSPRQRRPLTSSGGRAAWKFTSSTVSPIL